MNKYRIVKDGYLGYESQYRPIWWPFWSQCFFCNTHETIEEARLMCEIHAANPNLDRRLVYKLIEKDQMPAESILKKGLVVEYCKLNKQI